MYGKLFTQMYDGTLASSGVWQALVTFQQLVILADKKGQVDMTLDAIARRTTIPIDILEKGIAALSKPDPDSRSEAEEGRRIVLLEPSRTWGWRLVNHAHYRAMRTEDERREYHRNYARTTRAAKRELSTSVNKSTESQQSKPIAVSSKQEASKITAANAAVSGTPSVPDCPLRQIVDLYHEKLCAPGLPFHMPRVEKMTGKRAGQIKQRWRDDLKTLEAWANYFEYVATSRFLTGRTAGTNGRPPFVADLEYLTNESNFAKISEERYHRG